MARIEIDPQAGIISRIRKALNSMFTELFTAHIKRGVYAYLTTAANTTVVTADTFVPIQGIFRNDPVEHFSLGSDAIVCECDHGERYYEIDWHCTLSSQDATRTVHVGVAKNGETLTHLSPSAMSIYVKWADEMVNLSGTTVMLLAEGDTVQLQLTSDADGDIITVHHFTTTIRNFFDD